MSIISGVKFAKKILYLWLINRGGQNSSRLKSGPDYLVFLSRFFSGNCLVQTKSRFESGFYLDKFYFYFEKMSRLCPDSNLDFVWTRQFPEKNLDSIWTILKNKNEFCPDWIRNRFGKMGIHGPIKIKETMDRPENSDPWTTQNIGIHAKNTGINGRFRNIRIHGRFRNIGIHGPIKNIEIHEPVRI